MNLIKNLTITYFIMSLKSEPKISTITISTQLPYCKLNLTNIGKYLNIDDQVIGLKYNYADLSIMKGKYSTSIYKKAKNKNIDKIKKTLFYNQITIILNNNGNNVNVKLFGNGSLHLTGCKSENEGVDITKTIYYKLKSIIDKKDVILLTKDENGVLIDKDKLVYSYKINKTKTGKEQEQGTLSTNLGTLPTNLGTLPTNVEDDIGTYNIIGYKKDNSKYIINKKEYTIDHKTKMFISTKIEKKRQRSIINFKGENIGYSQIELFKNRNKFYKKNVNIYIDTSNNFIYYNNSILIGKIEYHIDENKVNIKDNTQDLLEIEYSCNPFENNKDNLDKLDKLIKEQSDKKQSDKLIKENLAFFKNKIDFNINCINVYFTINYEINRQRLYEQLLKLNFICKYNPESYSGIKLIYKISLNEKIEGNTKGNTKGICFCSNKCTCTNITFLIFQTGNIITTGFKKIEQIKEIINHFMFISNSLKTIVQRKIL